MLFHIRGVACAASELNTGIVRLRNSARVFRVPTPCIVPAMPSRYLWLSASSFGSFETRDCRTSAVASSNEIKPPAIVQTADLVRKYLASSAAAWWLFPLRKTLFKKEIYVPLGWQKFEFFGPRVTTVEAQSPALQLFHTMGERAIQFRSIAKILTPQEARNYTCEQVRYYKAL